MPALPAVHHGSGCRSAGISASSDHARPAARCPRPSTEHLRPDTEPPPAGTASGTGTPRCRSAGRRRSARPTGAPPPAAPPPPPPVPAPPPSPPPPAPPPDPAPADVEALAAAALADEPAPAAAPEPTTIDFQCPQCDAKVSLPSTLAGKRAPCP